MSSNALPEEILDHVHHLAGVHVDQQRVVPVTDPLRSRRRVRQAVHARIEPILLLVIVGLQPVSDVERPVPVIERVDVDAEAEHRPVTVAIIAPVVAAVVAPIPVPAAARPAAPLGHPALLLGLVLTLLLALILALLVVLGLTVAAGPVGPVARPAVGLARTLVGIAGPARSFARLLHVVAVPARHAVGTLPPGEAGLVVRLNLLLLPGLDLLLLANLELRPLAAVRTLVLDLLARLLALLAGLLAIGLLFVTTAAIPAVALVLRKRGRSRRAGEEDGDNEFTHGGTFSVPLPCEMRLNP